MTYEKEHPIGNEAALHAQRKMLLRVGGEHDRETERMDADAKCQECEGWLGPIYAENR